MPTEKKKQKHQQGTIFIENREQEKPLLKTPKRDHPRSKVTKDHVVVVVDDVVVIVASRQRCFWKLLYILASERTGSSGGGGREWFCGLSIRPVGKFGTKHTLTKQSVGSEQR